MNLDSISWDWTKFKIYEKVPVSIGAGKVHKNDSIQDLDEYQHRPYVIIHHKIYMYIDFNIFWILNNNFI